MSQMFTHPHSFGDILATLLKRPKFWTYIFTSHEYVWRRKLADTASDLSCAVSLLRRQQTCESRGDHFSLPFATPSQSHQGRSILESEHQALPLQHCSPCRRRRRRITYHESTLPNASPPPSGSHSTPTSGPTKRASSEPGMLPSVPPPSRARPLR